MLARYLRHLTSFIHTATEEINQSPDSLSTMLKQLLTQASIVERVNEESLPEMQLVEVSDWDQWKWTTYQFTFNLFKRLEELDYEFC